MTFSVRKSLIFTLIYCWSFLLMPSTLPGGIVTATLLGLLVATLSHFAFENDEAAFSMAKQDWQLLGAFLLLLLVCHHSVLFLPLSNDEPHHAERALFLLKSAVEWIYTPDTLPYPMLRDSFYQVTSLRGMAAVELWRIIFLGFCAVTAGVFGISRLIQKRSSVLFGNLTVVVGFACVGFFMRGWLDNHPPLRTFLPFLSSGVLGLNDFAFRFSSIFATAIFMLWLTKKIANHVDLKVAALLTILIVFPSTVLHTSVLLEPSIYGFFGWSAILIAIFDGLNDSKTDRLMDAAILVPIFALMRLPVILVALPVAIAFLLHLKVFKTRNILQLCAGILLVTPFMVTVATMGNGAAAKEFDLSMLSTLLTDGRPIGTWLRNWGAPWIVLFCLAWILFFKSRQKVWFLGLMFPVMFALYHLFVDRTAWGLGRYQAEYVGGFWALFVYAFSFQLSKVRIQISALVIATLFFCSTSLDQINRISSDNYSRYDQSQLISNMSAFPYRDAVQYIERQDGEISFVIAGGVPAAFESILWMSGYPLLEGRFWVQLQGEFQNIVNRGVQPEQLKQYLVDRKIKYLILQTGRRHERLSRVPVAHELLQKFEQGQVSSLGFSKIQSYEAPWGGILEIYRIN